MSSYKHKSGALKRKLQKEKLEQSEKLLKKFFKSNEKEELQEFQPYFNPEPTSASQTQPSSASIQNASTSTVCEGSNDECASADPNLSKDTVDDNKTFNFDDPNTWPAVMSDKIRQEIVSCCSGFQAFQARSKSFPADPSGKHFH